MPSRVSRRKLSQYYAERMVAGDSPEQLALHLAAFLLENHRTKEIDLIVRDIEFELSLRGEVVADIVTSHGLTAATKTQLDTMIKNQTHAKNIVYRQSEDPSQLGGIKLSLAGLQLDTTIRKKLNRLRANNRI